MIGIALKSFPTTRHVPGFIFVDAVNAIVRVVLRAVGAAHAAITPWTSFRRVVPESIGTYGVIGPVCGITIRQICFDVPGAINLGQGALAEQTDEYGNDASETGPHNSHLPSPCPVGVWSSGWIRKN